MRLSHATSDWRRSARSSNTSARDSRRGWNKLRRWHSIPRKRAQPPETIFLERDEIEATLAALPTDGRYALRDRALLVFLYNTGARVQEAADVRARDVHFDPTPRVHLHGKGDKWRVCPLWAETSGLLRKLISEQGPGSPPDQKGVRWPLKGESHHTCGDTQLPCIF